MTPSGNTGTSTSDFHSSKDDPTKSSEHRIRNLGNSETSRAANMNVVETRPNGTAGRNWGDLVWLNVAIMLYIHLAGLYGAYVGLRQGKVATLVYAILLTHLGGVGVTAGAHRLWSHKAYNAKWPMRVLLMILHTLAYQQTIVQWVRDHRVHHKFTDTDADPYNASRGFFFSHVGWMMMRKHPDVKEKGKTIDMSDVENDPIVAWQGRNFPIFGLLVCFVVPTFVPWYFWNETLWISWHFATMFRYALSLNYTWLVNSAAHMWGTKPYDRAITPTNNLFVSIVAVGEGWHNYHHVFPWDYKAAELGNYGTNVTTAFIDLCARLGLAYGLKTASSDMVRRRAVRTGDGNWIDHHDHSGKAAIWGWNDPDMRVEDVQGTVITNKPTK